VARLGSLLAEAPAGTMVHSGIKEAYDAELAAVAGLPGVRVAARSGAAGPHPATEARPALLVADPQALSTQERLSEEIYGPVTVAVPMSSREQVLEAARGLRGHLTATLHATPRDLAEYQELVRVLSGKAGRLVLNGVPTGVEVAHAMQHGGPWPATTDPRATSVGSAAILRFARPVCWQDFPDEALPAELQRGNPRGIWRTVDGRLTRDPA
jgi:alpha-ketoglutaric semialdehyde dehydrogenase